MKVNDLLETKRPRLLVTPSWGPEDVQYFHMDGGIQVVMPPRKPGGLLDINSTDAPTPRNVARQVIGSLLEMNEKQKTNFEIFDDFSEPITRFENQVRTHGAFLVKNSDKQTLEKLVVKCYEQQKAEKQAKLDVERRNQIHADKQFMKDLLKRDDDLKEARARLLSEDEMDLVNDIFLKLDDKKLGLNWKIPSTVSPNHFMNQYTIKMSGATVNVNPFLLAPNDSFAMRVQISPDEREPKLNIPDLHADPTISRKLQAKIKLSNNERFVAHAVHEVLQTMLDSNAEDIRYYVSGEDEWYDFDLGDDDTIDEILQMNRGKKIFFEASW